MSMQTTPHLIEVSARHINQTMIADQLGSSIGRSDRCQSQGG